MLLDRPARLVAPDLLGAVLTVDGVAVRLTEVEAYEGADDPASHAWRGPTRRNAVMFGPPGRLYVYLSYGIHSCVNVVCDVEGRAAAVLLRAGEVVAGEDLARSRRGAVPHARLASGPGNVGSALGLRPADSGLVLGGGRASLRLGPGAVGRGVAGSSAEGWGGDGGRQGAAGGDSQEQPLVPFGPGGDGVGPGAARAGMSAGSRHAASFPDRVASGPRVGISRATDLPWRYWLVGEPSVSGSRRA